jgi:hypothetical protein
LKDRKRREATHRPILAERLLLQSQHPQANAQEITENDQSNRPELISAFGRRETPIPRL